MSDKNFKVKSGLNIPIASANILTTDSSGNVSSSNTLAISAGGTGQTTAANALNALLPLQTGNENYYLQTNAVSSQWSKVYNQTIKNAGVTVNPRGTVNIVGATFADDSGTDTTTITFTDTTGVSKSGGDTITASSASTKGLIIKGATSQTANLQEWQDSAGNLLSAIRSDGVLRVSQIISKENYSSYFSFSSGSPIQVNPLTSGTVGLVVKAAASQTANLQEWQNSAGSVLASMSPAGRLTVDWVTSSVNLTNYVVNAADNGPYFYLTSTNASLTNRNTVSNVIFTIKGMSGQTGDLQQWQNPGGTAIALINASGDFVARNIYASTSAGYYTAQVNILPDSAAKAGIVIRGAASQTANLQEWQNSAGTVIARVQSDGAFVSDYITSGIYLTSLGKLRTGSASNYGAQLEVTSTVNTNIGAVVRGATSQTANLQEWQNSAGTVLAKVNASGSMFTTTATAGTNTTQVATTEFVKTAIDNLVASAPAALDTLDEIAQALNDDPNFYTTITSLTNLLQKQDTYTLMGVF